MFASFHPRKAARALAATGLGLLLVLVAPLSARAEGQIRIAEQFGVVYLLLNIAQDLQLIEKNAKGAGLEQIKVEFVKLSGGPVINDALLAANPQAHVVLNSYDVLGGPSSAVALYGTEKFRRDNPRIYKAFIDALAQAARFVQSNPEAAADIYLRINKSNVDRKLLLSALQSREVQFQITPQNTFALAQFMHRVGVIKHQPASARDYFFDDAHNARAN